MPAYIQLFHGRRDPAEDMQDWGFQGPLFGPCSYFHTTYADEIKFDTVERQGCVLQVVDDMVYYDGAYYGDWSVLAEPNGIVPQLFDPEKAKIPTRETPPHPPRAIRILDEGGKPGAPPDEPFQNEHGTIFTPVLLNGARALMRLDEADTRRTSGRGLGYRGQITDRLSGRRFRVYGKACSFHGCVCDALAIETTTRQLKPRKPRTSQSREDIDRLTQHCPRCENSRLVPDPATLGKRFEFNIPCPDCTVMTDDLREAYIKAPQQCPWCKSDDISAYAAPEINSGHCWQEIDCKACGRTWHDIYTLTGVELPD